MYFGCSVGRQFCFRLWKSRPLEHTRIVLSDCATLSTDRKKSKLSKVAIVQYSTSTTINILGVKNDDTGDVQGHFGMYLWYWEIRRIFRIYTGDSGDVLSILGVHAGGGARSHPEILLGNAGNTSNISNNFGRRYR